MMIVVGILAAFIVNAVLASSGDWRLMLGLAAVPSLILLVGMAFMPETPRFLVRTGEEQEAREVLDEVRSDTEDPDEEPERKVQEIREVEEKEEGNAWELLRASWVRPALVVAIGLAVLQQLIGINTIIYYAPTTLTSVGYGARVHDLRQPRDRRAERRHDGDRDPDRRPRRAQADAPRRPRRHGREPHDPRPVLAAARRAELRRRPGGSDHAALPGRLHRLVRATWGPGRVGDAARGPAPSVRGTAMGIAVCLHWGANFLVSQSFPVMLDAWGPGPVFLGYAAIGVLGVRVRRRSCPRRRAAAWRTSRRICSARRATPRASRRGLQTTPAARRPRRRPSRRAPPGVYAGRRCAIHASGGAP